MNFGPNKAKYAFGPPIAKNTYDSSMAKNIYGPSTAKNIYGPSMAENTLMLLREHSHMTSDVLGAFLTYLHTYPNQILYFISLFSKIRYTLTYLPT